MKALPTWTQEKLWIEPTIIDELGQCGITKINQEIFYPLHHQSHAASAFYPSPFEEAAVMTLDGVGEWTTASIGTGEGATLRMLKELEFPHSLGLLYSAFTYFTGFKVNSGEYKLMGLAPYGEPTYRDLILEHLLDLKDDGSFRLNMDYFGYLDDLVMTNERFEALFKGPARKPEHPITPREINIARSIQEVTEEIVLRMGRHAREVTGKENLCLAGGVALNCVANGKLLREKIFKDIWIQPAAGDAGGALGAAMSTWHNALGNPRRVSAGKDQMRGAYLGPSFSDHQIQEYLDAHGYVYERLDKSDWATQIASKLANHHVVGLFCGRMEYGPRALGHRSILGDPRSQTMQSVMNLKIKEREGFRPFAPACLKDQIENFFELDRPSPYMLFVAPVKKERCYPPKEGEQSLDLIERINQPRSELPAITHVDYSARVQSVDGHHNPKFKSILEAFQKETGYGVLINTSFNVRGEPIVCTPEDACRCFMRTDMDYLVLESFLLEKTQQPHRKDDQSRQKTFPLD
jgi:carbamoyltransferase